MERNFVTFEQAKLLKEKRFCVACVAYYHIDEHHKDSEPIETDNNFSNTKIMGNAFTAPEQWQIVEWLRIEKKIWISVKICFSTKEPYYFDIDDIKGEKAKTSKFVNHFYSPKEAYSKAFDYILKELL